MSVWNPEEHYIWIEPNVKYLLSSAGAIHRAPLPWYERPPPRPHNAIPPVDKLRFVSTRRLQNAFENHPWKQTVADDLDSFTQTLLHSLLFRGGSDVAGFEHLFRRLGNEDVHSLREWRYDVREMFWRRSDGVKRSMKAREERKRDGDAAAAAASGGDAAGEDNEIKCKGKGRAQASMDGPTGMQSMINELFELLDVSEKQWAIEQNLFRRYTWTQDEDRVKKQYSKYLTAFEAVRDAFELSDQRRQARKERKKAKEMLKQGAADGNVQEGQSNAGEEKMDVVVEPKGAEGGENETKTQDDNASASPSQGEEVSSAASPSVDAGAHEPVEEGERSSRVEADDDDTDEPLKKRPRTE